MVAGDRWARTEPPTPRRRKKAREEGQVAKSPEIGAWIAILAASIFAPTMLSFARASVLVVTSSAFAAASHESTSDALAVLEGALREFLIYGAVVGGAFMVLALVAGAAQVGRSISLKAARPRLQKLNPKAGIQRLFSPKAFWELGKQVLKLAIIAALGYSALRSLAFAVASKEPVAISTLLDYTGSSLLNFVRTAAVIGMALGLVDYGIQRHRVNQQLKMTKQEVRDERKQQTGDPTVRMKLRRRAFSIARSKTIAAVRTADVVVTNPTHVAVALQYEPKRHGVPRVVAKGIDSLALRVREEAATLGIPVVEDPPLARYLHATCTVGQEIPKAVYVAVAQLIAFVYTLDPSRRRAGVHRRPHSLVPSIDPEAPPAEVLAVRERRRLLASARATDAS